MSSPRRTRRQSAAVYRRRRLMVLVLAVLIVIGIVWLAVAQPWRALFGGAEPTPSPTASAAATPTPTPTPTPTAEPEAEETPTPEPSETPPAEVKPCAGKAVEVVALTDQQAYAPDQQPKLSLQLTNTGDVDCTFNVGTSTQVFEISSGDDTWWRSTDCQSEPADMVVTLAAGQVVNSVEPVVWDRTRSSVDSCESPDRPRAAGGGATYHLSVAIGGVQSTQAAPFILQ